MKKSMVFVLVFAIAGAVAGILLSAGLLKIIFGIAGWFVGLALGFIVVGIVSALLFPQEPSKPTETDYHDREGAGFDSVTGTWS
jgi:hypothetical protein